MSRWFGRRRVRYVPQLEVTECGAASLVMVLDFYGCSIPLVEAREACAVSRDGVSAARILRAARDYGLDARGLKLEPQSLKDLPLPAILHWELNHFVVLERTTSRGVVLVDPACGRRFVSHEALREAFTGVVLAFEPTPKLAPRPPRPRSLARYVRALASERRALCYVALCTLFLQLLALLFATSTQVLVDHVIKPHRDAWLVPLALVLGVGLLARHTLQFLRDRVTLAMQTSLDLTLTSEFVRHLMHLPLSFFEQRTSGDLLQRVDANEELRQIGVTVALSGLDALLLISYAGLMLAYDVWLGALTLAVSLSRVLVLQLAGGHLRQGAERLQSLAGNESAAMVEGLSAPEMMRAAGAESALFTRYNARMGDRLNAELALQRVSSGVSTGMTVFDGAALALLLWLGGLHVLDGRMTIGVFAGFMVLSRLVDAPLGSLLASLDRLLYAQAILARVDDVLDTAADPEGTRTIPVLRGEIVFDRVSFRHGPSTPWLFQELSFRVEAGEKVAIVGRSGQGKSTIMKLLLGVVQPSSGQISLDGVDLRELAPQSLARQLGVVVQEPFLLADTIEQNLRLRAPDASSDEIEYAARVACVHEVVTALPHGYQTKLGQRGTDLSGGQRQRLAIARAVVGKPGLLLLDEATSSLDLETEAAVHENLGRLGCTRLLIAHRLATVRDADRILLIDNGAIVQEGRFAELAQRNGPFRDLIEAHAP